MIRSPHVRVLGMVGAMVGLLLGVGAGSAAGSGSTGGEVQRFVLVQTDPEVSGGPIAATGAIHAKGMDVVLSDTRDSFQFPQGNVVIKHRPGSSAQKFDPVTCLFTISERGTWHALRGSGAYEGVSGGGHYQVFGQGFGCSQNEPPTVFFVRIVAQGALSL